MLMFAIAYNFLSTVLSQMKTCFQVDQCLKNPHFVLEFVVVISDLKTLCSPY